MAARPVPRFLDIADVAEVLNISASQAYALVRRGELPAIKVGGRGQWRVETTALESYIADAYKATKKFIAEHPFVGDDAQPDRSDLEADDALDPPS